MQGCFIFRFDIPPDLHFALASTRLLEVSGSWELLDFLFLRENEHHFFVLTWKRMYRHTACFHKAISNGGFVFELHSRWAFGNQPLIFTCSNIFTSSVVHTCSSVFTFCFYSPYLNLFVVFTNYFVFTSGPCSHLKFYFPQKCSFVFTSSFVFTFNIVCIWCIFTGRMPDVSSGGHTAHIPDSTHIPEHLFYHWASHNAHLHPDTKCVKIQGHRS